ncbi:MAG: TMEM164-related integral membrane acyltransferase [Gammaproteobacteria bacterium]
MPLAGFSLFSAMHLAYLGAWVLLWVLIPWIGMRFLGLGGRRILATLLATITVVQEAVDYLNRMTVRDLNVLMDLPLQFCHLAQIFSLLLLFFRMPLLFEVTYFWGLIGALQAMLTPDLNAFENYLSLFLFFMHHGLLILIIFWLVFVVGYRCRPGAVTRTFFFTNVVMLPVALVDWSVGANYMYLRASPVSNSPFISFGWPWYILQIEIIGVLMMIVLQFPMRLARGSGFGVLLARRGPGPEL